MDFPTGAILIWSGAIGAIPAGYTLCDGTAGTPDLRDRFVRGAGLTFNPDDNGGASVHTHTFTGDGHAHAIAAGGRMEGGLTYDDVTDPADSVGTTNNGSSIPPYYALAFIMKT